VVTCDHIVSLGSSCRVAFNLRRHYDFGKAFPFDWWITPPAGLIRALEDIAAGDERRLIDPDVLAVRGKGKRASVVNTRYDIIMPHDFPRDDWRKGHADACSRTQKLVDDLRALSGSIAFFYRFSANLESGADMRRAILSAVRRLFPECLMVFVNCPHADDGALTLQVTEADDDNTDWRGDPKAWDRALATLPLRLAERDRKRFSPSRKPIAADRAETRRSLASAG
jgi:hypothetical protein